MNGRRPNFAQIPLGDWLKVGTQLVKVGTGTASDWLLGSNFGSNFPRTLGCKGRKDDTQIREAFHIFFIFKPLTCQFFSLRKYET